MAYCRSRHCIRCRDSSRNVSVRVAQSWSPLPAVTNAPTPTCHIISSPLGCGCSSRQSASDRGARRVRLSSEVHTGVLVRPRTAETSRDIRHVGRATDTTPAADGSPSGYGCHWQSERTRTRAAARRENPNRERPGLPASGLQPSAPHVPYGTVLLQQKCIYYARARGWGGTRGTISGLLYCRGLVHYTTSTPSARARDDEVGRHCVREAEREPEGRVG